MPKTKIRVVDAYVFRQTNNGLRFLILKRAETKIYEHLWQGVAGKIEKGEKAWQAAIRELKEETGFGIIVNTSFNVRGEPIVCMPEDAFKCFMGTELDVLVVGNCVLRKEQQDKSLTEDYKDKYELD